MITYYRPIHGTVRKSKKTGTRHSEHKISTATNSLFPREMITKLESKKDCKTKQGPNTKKNPQTMGTTTNNK